MKHNCFLQGHVGDGITYDYNKGDIIKETCIHCGKHRKGEYNTFYLSGERMNLWEKFVVWFENMWVDHVWFQISSVFLFATIGLYLIFLFITLLIYPFAAGGCDAQAGAMGLQHYYNLYGGCMVNY